MNNYKKNLHYSQYPLYPFWRVRLTEFNGFNYKRFDLTPESARLDWAQRLIARHATPMPIACIEQRVVKFGRQRRLRP